MYYDNEIARGIALGKAIVESQQASIGRVDNGHVFNSVQLIPAGISLNPRYGLPCRHTVVLLPDLEQNEWREDLVEALQDACATAMENVPDDEFQMCIHVWVSGREVANILRHPVQEDGGNWVGHSVIGMAIPDNEFDCFDLAAGYVVREYFPIPEDSEEEDSLDEEFPDEDEY